MTPAARDRRFGRIREIGCLACRQLGWYGAPDVHHLNLGEHAGQVRRGDEYTIGLCPWHHRGIGKFVDIGPSLAKEPVKFRQRFGSDDELLAKQNELIAEAEKAVVGREHVA